MEQKDLIKLAQQLACPKGEQGLSLATKMNIQNANIINSAIDALAPVKGEHILEIGFGNGELSEPIIEKIGAAGHYTGVEQSNELAQQALNRFTHNGFEQVTIHAKDCHAVDIDENTLDGVLAVNVLYFINDLSVLFNKVYDWLKPGGRMVLGVRSATSLQSMPFTQYGFNIRTQDEIENALHATGFSHIENDYFDEGSTQFEDLTLVVDSLVISASK